MYRLAIAGMGGFAASHHQEAVRMETDGRARLICTCDPAPERFPELQESLAQRGVAVYRNYAEMLTAHRGGLDVVALPTPVPLHAPMHAAAVQDGLWVYLEKPPTLDWRELESMIETDRKAPIPTLVGFNFIGDPTRRKLKQRIAAGEFGPIRRLELYGYRPRPESYYRRAAWAGRLMLDGKLVLDSCIGNADAHAVHNMLFWAGGSLDTFGRISRVEAQLYRAHCIESTDTVFLRALLAPGDVPLRIVDSHACAAPADLRETVVCAQATIQVHTDRKAYEIHWGDGGVESAAFEPLPFSLMRNNYESLFAVREGREIKPFTTLEDCRAFVALNDLAYRSSATITTVDRAHCEVYGEKESAGVAIRGLRETGAEFLASGDFPRLPDAPWAGPIPAPVTPTDLTGFDAAWVAARLARRDRT
ncbi:MAG: hypothetical protein A3K19_13715 [Lentisphaerae bacterium RIFOXYB12_FULL_65_16]|nr:MAG: hypothetical protein A3K18_00020 [Lentisphaerae bacterium RIFOXYA12_64_32]OGV84207.1 MAG: hypothetical protein A3K19_13715 [Lentisphaerae bacterium RIFOXYB12_FULL_65_16]